MYTGIQESLYNIRFIKFFFLNTTRYRRLKIRYEPLVSYRMEHF